jgi:hypothetical protein
VQRKGFDSLAWLVVWSLWCERNRKVHDRVALQPVALASLKMPKPSSGPAVFRKNAIVLGVRLS